MLVDAASAPSASLDERLAAPAAASLLGLLARRGLACGAALPSSEQLAPLAEAIRLGLPRPRPDRPHHHAHHHAVHHDMRARGVHPSLRHGLSSGSRSGSVVIEHLEPTLGKGTDVGTNVCRSALNAMKAKMAEAPKKVEAFPVGA